MLVLFGLVRDLEGVVYAEGHVEREGAVDAVSPAFEQPQHHILYLAFLGLVVPLRLDLEGVHELPPDTLLHCLPHPLSQRLLQAQRPSELNQVPLDGLDLEGGLIRPVHLGQCLLHQGDEGVPEVM